MPFALGRVRACLLARTLKPMMTAPEALGQLYVGFGDAADAEVDDAGFLTSSVPSFSSAQQWLRQSPARRP
jgi:hypothetical protein